MVRSDDEKFVFDAGEDEDGEDPVVVGGVGGGGDEDDEDDEANEDLSLKILEKALSRQAIERSRNQVDFDDSNETSMADLCASSSVVARFAMVNGEKSEILKEEKVNRKKNKKIEVDSAQETSIVTKDEEGVEMAEEVTTDEKAEVDYTKEVEESMEPNTGETANNMVLRKLLRGPRYFDPPDGGWDTCYNCGERGHMAINCPTLTKRKKPCFVCGSLEHGAKQCPKAQDCFICKKGGHRAKDCPDKYKSGSKSTTICLRCGDSEHDMFSCKYEYSQDDLKDIQCYVCRSFGHLCCVNPIDSPRQVLSCYRCGQPGHTGLACGRLNEESSRKESPSSCFRCGEGGHFARECPNSSSISFPRGGDSPHLCYKCGEGGHFARECKSSTRIHKRNRDKSTPSLRPHRKSREDSGYNSAPLEPNGKPKRKKTRDQDSGLTTPRKPKHRGGWITEDPEEDSSQRKIKNRKPRSPSTPSSNKNHRFAPLNSGGRFSSSSASRMPPSSHHRYSASRFGHRQHAGFGTINYDRW